MIETVIKKKFFDLQAELELIKRTLIKKPDFDADEKNWKTIKSNVKKIREKLYKERYEK